ncbi:SHOCT domain-containing protein [Conyzicola sp.]|uniref:SHOCT domain-containing protein n=1 Tax=Conyzicola sp. TaxID=1969404 RepID=UPI003988BF04
MPLFRRFGRPGLLGELTSVGVVAGTASMIAVAVGRDPEDRAVPEQVPPVHDESIPSQLATLSSLYRSGAISDEEFTRAKNRVLGW